VTQIEILLRTKHESSRQRNSRMPLGQIWRHQHNNGKINSRANRMYEGWNFNSGNYLFTTDTK